jgi:hypothetical protein
MGFLQWLKTNWTDATVIASASQSMSKAATETELEGIWISLTEDQKKDLYLSMMYQGRKKEFGDISKGLTDPLEVFMTDALNEWLNIIQKYDVSDPAKAKENLIALSADVMKIAGATAAIDIGLGMLPNSAGTASSTNTKQMLAWLGFGAVLAAVAHDPVKIGLLRPYQDTLEATFRNRRPGDADLFTAYQQRSLSSTKIEDVNAIDEALMTKIESENDAYYDTEIAKWGYSPYFSNALKDAATKTLSFGNLMALAKQGRLNRGMAIFSLWGYGLDRRLMKIALDALDQANETANYEGFRAQIEPAYIEGSIDEASLLDYWAKLHIPKDVQDLMLPRFRKKREAYTLKLTTSAPAKERDLTVSQLQQAYQNQLMERGIAQNAMLTLGYTMDEVKILLDLAEMRRKLPSAQTLKRLPLSDYEKAEKSGLITIQEVLDRMKGEYTAEDIDLELQLLKIGKA